MKKKNVKKASSPLLMLISRTRNYAWVTRAFLEGNIRWADYIIITDQMSTDGTREICAEYNDRCNSKDSKCKGVVLVDDYDMEFKENAGFRMAFAKGREVADGRDTIFFALDIDEVMPANWKETMDGRRILNSKPGDMFSVAWANIQIDNVTYEDLRMHWGGKYTIFHDNGIEWQETGLEFHSPHLPYSTWNVDPYAIKDFPLLHFGWYNPKWNRYKALYHQMLDIHQHRSSSPIAFYRTYREARKTLFQKYCKRKTISNPQIKPIEKEWLFRDFDLFSMIDMSSVPIFVGYIQELIELDGLEKYYCIDIWDEELLQIAGIDADPRPVKWRMLHMYESITQPYKKTLLVRAIDKVLKKMIKE